MKKTRSTGLLCCLLALTLIAGCAQSKTGTIKSADGLDISYEVVGQGSPTLVFVHCWSGDKTYWDAQKQHFSKTNKVVTLDLAGHGESALGREKWTMPAYGADVAAVVNKLNLKNVVLVGHSMGGAVIVEAALQLPDRILGLVGVDNFKSVELQITNEQIDGYIQAYHDNFVEITQVRIGSTFPEETDPELKAAIVDDMSSAPAEIAIASMGELLYWSKDQAKVQLPKLKLPLHCINSDRSLTDVEGLKAAVGNFKVRLMPGLGHFLPREDPELFNKLLTETVNDLKNGPVSE